MRRRGVGIYGPFPGPDVGVYTGLLSSGPEPADVTAPNVYDRYLQTIADRGQSAMHPDPTAPASPLHQVYPSLFPVPGYQRFDFGAAIGTPAQGAGDTVIFSFAVPFGWDGVILLVSHNIIGAPGFLDGSGDLIWRLAIDGRAVKNYDNITYQFGSLANPRPTEIPVLAGQVFQYVVNNATGVIPAGTTIIIATANGRFWPRQDS